MLVIPCNTARAALLTRTKRILGAFDRIVFYNRQ